MNEHLLLGTGEDKAAHHKAALPPESIKTLGRQERQERDVLGLDPLSASECRGLRLDEFMAILYYRFPLSQASMLAEIFCRMVNAEDGYGR